MPKLSDDDDEMLRQLRELKVRPPDKLPTGVSPDLVKDLLRLPTRPSSAFELATGMVVKGTLQCYRLGSVIHGGGQSKNSLSCVYEATVVNAKKGHGDPSVVLKFPNWRNPDLRVLNRFHEELDRLRQLPDHCHWVLHLSDWGELPTEKEQDAAPLPFAVFPKYTKTASDCIPAEGRALDSFAACLLAVLDFLHNRLRLFHVDIKPKNLLVPTIENTWGERMESLVLSDLGSAVPFDTGAGLWQSSTEYAPAGIRLGSRWTIQAELHCVAMTLCELATKRLPERGNDQIVKRGACAELLKTKPDSFRWGGILDRAIAGEFQSVAELRDAARSRGLLMSKEADCFLEPQPTPWLEKGMMKWLRTAAGAALAGLAIGGTMLADDMQDMTGIIDEEDPDEDDEEEDEDGPDAKEDDPPDDDTDEDFEDDVDDPYDDMDDDGDID